MKHSEDVKRLEKFGRGRFILGDSNSEEVEWVESVFPRTVHRVATAQDIWEMLRPRYRFARTEYECLLDWWGPDKKPTPNWTAAGTTNALTFNMPW